MTIDQVDAAVTSEPAGVQHSVRTESHEIVTPAPARAGMACRMVVLVSGLGAGARRARAS